MNMDEYLGLDIEQLSDLIRHKPIRELRFELSQLNEFRDLRCGDIPAPIVRAFFFLVLVGAMDDCPPFLAFMITKIINWQRDGEISHQWQLDELRQELASKDSDFAQGIISLYEDYTNSI